MVSATPTDLPAPLRAHAKTGPKTSCAVGGGRPARSASWLLAGTLLACLWLAVTASPVFALAGDGGWSAVGGAANGPGNANIGEAVAVGSGNPYIAEAENNGGIGLFVRQWSGATWTQLGGAAINISSSQPLGRISMAVDAGTTPYVAWHESVASGQVVNVKKYSGSWSQLGTGLRTNTVSGIATAGNVAVSAGTAYVGWSENNGTADQVYIDKYVAAWANLGGSLNLDVTKNASPPQVSIIGTTPWATWTETNASAVAQVVVKHYNGASWITDSSSLNIDAAKSASSSFITNDGTNIYVGWNEVDGSGLNQIYVKKFDGVSWSQLPGSANYDPAINAALNGVTYAANAVYVGQSQTVGGVTHPYATRSNSGWQRLGDAPTNDPEETQTASMAVSSAGTVYMAFDQFWGTTNRAYVKQWLPSQIRVFPMADRTAPTGWYRELSGGFCTASTTNMFTMINDDTDVGQSQVCTAGAADDYLRTPAGIGSSTQDFDLTDSTTNITTINTLTVRMRTKRNGAGSSSVTVTLHKADTSVVAAPLVQTPTVADAQQTYVLTSLSLTRADLDGMYVTVAGSVLSGSSAWVYISGIDITATYTPAIVISGSALNSEGGSGWSQCDGTTNNVSVSLNGAAKTSTFCTAGTGAYSMRVQATGTDQQIAAFLDPASAGDQGVTYTRSIDTGQSVTGLNIARNVVWLDSRTPTYQGNAAINVFDASQSANIPANSNGNALTVPAGVEVHVGAGKTFQPGGNVTATALHLAGRYVGGALDTLTLTGSGTGACTAGAGVMRPLCIDTGSFIVWPLHLTRLTGTGAVNVQGASYGRLELQPAGAGSPTYALGSGVSALSASTLTIGDGTNPVTASTTSYAPATTVDGQLTVSGGATLSGTGSGTTIVTGAISGGGTITLAGGLFEQHPGGSSANFGSSGGAANWDFNNLRFSDHIEPIWGTAGAATYNSAATNDDRVNAIAVDPAGNTYAVGYVGTNGNDFAARKYLANGALDTSWGTSGMVTWNSGGAAKDMATAAAVDADGNLYVGGTAAFIGTSDGNWAVRKYTAAGTLDTAWGTGGMVSLDSGPTTTDNVKALALCPDGSLYVGGTYQPDTQLDSMIRKYTPAGLLDASWGAAGLYTFATAGALTDELTGLARAADGSLYFVEAAGATGSTDILLGKLTPGGILDSGFSGGTVSYNSGTADAPGAVATDVNGNVYFSGYISTNGTDLIVRKYSATGASDLAWGTSGMVTYNSGAAQLDYGSNLVVDPASNLTVGGYQQTNGFDWVIRRYDATGTLDTRFGAGTGMVTYDSGASTTDAVRGAALDKAGNLYSGGYASPNGNDWMVRKYDPGGNLVDSSASAPAKSVLSTGGTGVIHVTGDVNVGVASDPGVTTLDAEANDRIINVDANLTIGSKGAIAASSSAAFTINGNFTRNGTFTPGTGTVTLAGAATSVLSYAGATTFYGLSVLTPAKQVQFPTAQQTNITALTVNGGACGTPVLLRSTLAGTQFPLSVTGTRSVAFADVKDSNSVTAPSIPTTNSVNGGNNTGWTITSCSGASISIALDGYDAGGGGPHSYAGGPPVVDATSDLGTGGPGVTQYAESRATVITTNATGYTLYARDGDANGGLYNAPLLASVPWLATGDVTTPAAWSGSGLGISAFAGSQTPARWCTGGQVNCTSTSDPDLLWAALTGTDQGISGSSVATGGDITRVPYRLTVPAAQPAGIYTGSIVFTAVAAP